MVQAVAFHIVPVCIVSGWTGSSVVDEFDLVLGAFARYTETNLKVNKI